MSEKPILLPVPAPAAPPPATEPPSPAKPPSPFQAAKRLFEREIVRLERDQEHIEASGSLKLLDYQRLMEIAIKLEELSQERKDPRADQVVHLEVLSDGELMLLEELQRTTETRHVRPTPDEILDQACTELAERIGHRQ